jgi:hypothetical protein
MPNLRRSPQYPNSALRTSRTIQPRAFATKSARRRAAEALRARPIRRSARTGRWVQRTAAAEPSSDTDESLALGVVLYADLRSARPVSEAVAAANVRADRYGSRSSSLLSGRLRLHEHDDQGQRAHKGPVCEACGYYGSAHDPTPRRGRRRSRAPSLLRPVLSSL